MTIMIVGRIRPVESLFYYDAENGLHYDYYNNASSYTPLFDIQPTPDQQQEARRVCTVDGVLIEACAYDFYATGNAFASSITASVNHYYGTAQNSLGSSVILLSIRQFKKHT